MSSAYRTELVGLDATETLRKNKIFFEVHDTVLDVGWQLGVKTFRTDAQPIMTMKKQADTVVLHRSLLPQKFLGVGT